MITGEYKILGVHKTPNDIPVNHSYIIMAYEQVNRSSIQE